MGVPVDQALAAINQTLFIHLDKGLDDSVVEIRSLRATGLARCTVHRKGKPRPVHRCAKTFVLGHNRAARLFFPFPDFLSESLAAQFDTAGAACFCQLTFDNHLSCDAGVIETGLPQRIEPLHPLPTDQNIHQSVVERVAHV